MNDTPTRAGFAAILGAPNAGKSTLVNRLVGSKVSIVTQKVQTTRFPVRGVAMAGEAARAITGRMKARVAIRRLNGVITSRCSGWLRGAQSG